MISTQLTYRMWALVLTVVSLCPLGTQSAAAADARVRTDRAALVRLLSAVDTTPDIRAISRLAPGNTAQKLVELARDSRLADWPRLRAISVLPAFGRSGAAALLRLAKRSKFPPRLRWWAIFGWLRTPLLTPVALAQAKRWLLAPQWRVREATVRGMRGKTQRAVTQLLRAHLRHERHATVRAALRHVLRKRRR